MKNVQPSEKPVRTRGSVARRLRSRGIGTTQRPSTSPLYPSFEPAVAYFSMEVAVNDAIPTYCGGLGVLAGDHLRAAADLCLPVVGVTLCYRTGYFRQRLDDEGHQHEDPVVWSPRDLLEELDARTSVTICGRPVALRAWRHCIVGSSGSTVPVLFLDADLEENDERDRSITDQIYGGDPRHRLSQEAVLGLGGLRLLEELGWNAIPTFHMNEGHSALLTLALLNRAALDRGTPGPAEVAAVRARCVFTTHTPVPAGHDRFPEEIVREVLGEELRNDLVATGNLADGELNMTRLGMSFSRFVNAVSLRHGELARAMFPSIPIRSITNGVHAAAWVAPSTAELLDRYAPEWRRDNASLRYSTAIPLPELEAAHRLAKNAMIHLVADRTGVALDPEVLTLGVARRAATYKRVDLLLADPDRLRAIAGSIGPLQLVYSGKAHPQDEAGKAMIVHVHAVARELDDVVRVVFVPDYSLEIARYLCSGSDVWVNTPARPSEASGTSGMKAALNGVPSLSVLDGWWIEGHVEGVTGWSIGSESADRDDAGDGEDLYAKLETLVAPLYYHEREQFCAVGRSALALNGSFYTTERMTTEYAILAYDPPLGVTLP